MCTHPASLMVFSEGPNKMVMQIRRTFVPDNPPTGLADGQLSVEAANDPPRFWVGVPTDIDPVGRRRINAASEVILRMPTSSGSFEMDGAVSNEVHFRPLNGDLIRINGTLEQIPYAGVTANVTNAFVNGVAGASVQPQTSYYVFAFMNGSNMVLDFRSQPT